MTSLERVVTVLSHAIPDRVPLFLMLSLYGAKEAGVSPKQYYSDPNLIVKTQLEMHRKYRTDCLESFFHAPLEFEAMGGEVIYVDDGPPNAGMPVIRSTKDIRDLEMPDPKHNPVLQRVLEVTHNLKAEARGEIPVVGIILSPFSLPVLQIGFEAYLNLLYYDREGFDLLMRKNAVFAIEWANAQVDAGADAIGYFDPLASPSMIESETYLKTGYPVDEHTVRNIKAPVAVHLASGLSFPAVESVVDMGAAALGFSAEDDPAKIKKAAQNRLGLLGNLNGLDMVHWDETETREQVRTVIQQAGKNGGLILSDNHGEIPWHVPEQVLLWIGDAVDEFGRYDTDGGA